MLYIKLMSANPGLSITYDGLYNRTLRGAEPSREPFLFWFTNSETLYSLAELHASHHLFF